MANNETRVTESEVDAFRATARPGPDGEPPPRDVARAILQGIRDRDLFFGPPDLRAIESGLREMIEDGVVELPAAEGKE